VGVCANNSGCVCGNNSGCVCVNYSGCVCANNSGCVCANSSGCVCANNSGCVCANNSGCSSKKGHFGAFDKVLKREGIGPFGGKAQLKYRVFSVCFCVFWIELLK